MMRQHGESVARTGRNRRAKLFSRILVPIDLSRRNVRPLKVAAALARQAGASVTLFHVVHEVPGLAAGEMRVFYDRLLEMSRGKLSRAAKAFAARGIAVRFDMCVGEPTREIVRVAARGRADLIVMGSHKVDPRRRGAGWGTTSYKVGLLCACPATSQPMGEVSRMSFGNELVAQLLENWRGKDTKPGATVKDEVAVPPWQVC